MSVNVCPIATINAPIERVWNFLSEPANYALWWEAQTRSITPEGTAQPGQRVYAQLNGLGIQFDLNLLVEGVEADKHLIHLKTMLPFGITAFNHITCTALSNSATQVSFG